MGRRDRARGMMLDVLLLRFDAPMMSFGAVAVDAIGHTSPFPGRSLLTGLLGNALGFDHRDGERLTRLQERVRHAVRRDTGGEVRTDYQTVDLGQAFLLDEVAWTSWGRLDPRGGSAENKIGTHIRRRDYLVDSVFTLALTLMPSDDPPDIDAIEAALRRPARPLYLGRKCCVPASPLLIERTHAASLLQAVRAAPAPPIPRKHRSPMRLWWPEGDDPASESGGHRVTITDARDWFNQVHVGTHVMYEGRLERPDEEADHGR